MFILLHHHLEPWDQNAPRDDPRPELIEYGHVDVLVTNGCFTCLLNVAVMERKRLSGGLSLGN